MQLLDDRILEHLAEEPWSSPAVMARLSGVDASAGRVRERCELLAHAELVTPMHSDVYEITGQGERYLAGEYDVDWFPLPEPAQRILVGRA